jgi:hypothetical protein
MAGWASGSIEGRIAVEYFDAELESRKYAFRCHRQTVDGVDCVYPINALAYHPMYVTITRTVHPVLSLCANLNPFRYVLATTRSPREALTEPSQYGTTTPRSE